MLPNIEDKFDDQSLFKLSVTHSSWVNESKDLNIQSNERLEFLGDAILDAVVAQYLYSKYPNETEGDLTKFRSHLVSGFALAEVGRDLGIGDYLVLGKGEEASGGREKDSNLANAFEAIVGALFLDGGYEMARVFILETLDIEEKSAALITGGNDPKTQLQMLVQAKCAVAPHYRIISRDGLDHKPIFIVEVLVGEKVITTGQGSSRNRAEMEAASKALMML